MIAAASQRGALCCVPLRRRLMYIHYHQAERKSSFCVQRVKPATAAAIETASDLSATAASTARHLVRQSSVHGATLHRSASQRAGEAWRGLSDGAAAAWKGAGPTAQGYAAAVQVGLPLQHTVRLRSDPALDLNALTSMENAGIVTPEASTG